MSIYFIRWRYFMYIFRLIFEPFGKATESTGCIGQGGNKIKRD